MRAVWIVRCCIVTLAVAVSATDIRSRRLPDWLTLPPVGLGLAAFAWRLHSVGVGLASRRGVQRRCILWVGGRPWNT